MYDVAHGAGLAALWGSWARYVMDNCMDRFVKFAVDVMDVEDTGNAQTTALRGIEKMEAFFREIGMPTSISELGIDLSALEILTLAAKCKETAGGSLGAAKVLQEEDFIRIYEMAR